MKKIIKYSLVAVFLLGAFACNNSPKVNKNVKPGVSILNDVEISNEELAAIEAAVDSFITDKNRWVWPDSIKDITIMSDSLQEVMANDTAFYLPKYWTPEQKKLDLAIIRIYVENIDLENNRLVLHLSREDFLKKGIPEAHYDKLVQNIEDLNFFNKIYKRSPELIAEDRETMKKEFQQLLLDNPE